MTIASITTDINFGPYIIPSNAQNMIMNFFANRINISIELVIPEPIFSFQYATTLWLHKQYNFTELLLCSIHQLPRESNHIKKLVTFMPNVKLHFALEGESGIINEKINYWSEQIDVFDACDTLNGKDIGWLGMYNIMAHKS